MHRCLWWHLQTSIQFCPRILHADHESSSVWLDAWNEVRWTLPAASETVSLSIASKHNRGCQSVVHSLPTLHMQFTCSLFSKTVNQHGSLPLHDSAACGSCARPMPQTGILTFAVQIMVCVYWPRRFRCIVCWIRKLNYFWNILMIPVLQGGELLKHKERTG